MRPPLNSTERTVTDNVSVGRPDEDAACRSQRPAGQLTAPNQSVTDLADAERLETLQRATFGYFERMTNPLNGLVRDNSHDDSPASIAGSGFAMACQVVAVERGYTTRSAAVERVLTALRFLWSADQSARPNATGHRGFFYHFLDMATGTRWRRCELSSIDTALLIAGVLVAADYFDGDNGEERELRKLADSLYRRVNWSWMLDSHGAVSNGWRPGRGFIPYAYTGYNEALFLYILALASPTHPIPSTSYERWLSTYSWKSIYGYQFLYAGPLFIHQTSHCWIDFRGIQDAFMREHGIDYFENSRRATYIQQEYARRNPRGFRGYGKLSWGITASDGPGPAQRMVDGRSHRFYGYRARGVPYGADDGTLSPWAVAASLPFAPEIVLPTLEAMDTDFPQVTGEFGYECSFNPSFDVPDDSGDNASWGRKSNAGWIGHHAYAISQGPVVMMLENYRTELIWRLTRRSPYILNGLRRAGFTGGWLESR